MICSCLFSAVALLRAEKLLIWGAGLHIRNKNAILLLTKPKNEAVQKPFLFMHD